MSKSDVLSKQKQTQRHLSLVQSTETVHLFLDSFYLFFVPILAISSFGGCKVMKRSKENFLENLNESNPSISDFMCPNTQKYRKHRKFRSISKSHRRLKNSRNNLNETKDKQSQMITFQN